MSKIFVAAKIIDSFCMQATRVARWIGFKPKIPIWEKFSGSPLEKC
jgi:hypothetical protein